MKARFKLFKATLKKLAIPCMYRRSEPVVWTTDSAKRLRFLRDNATLQDFAKFWEDEAINSILLHGKDTDASIGYREFVSRLHRFCGVDESITPEPDPTPDDLYPISISDDLLSSMETVHPLTARATSEE